MSSSEAWREIVGGGNVQPISKKGTRWPPNQSIPEEWIELGHATRKRLGLPRINLRIEAENFVDYWTAATGSNAYKLDWLATWRRWARTARGTPEPEPVGRSYVASSDDASIKRAKLALRGIRVAMFDIQDVRIALAKGAITQEEARRLGL